MNKRVILERPGKHTIISLGTGVILLLMALLYIMSGNATLTHLMELKNKKASLEKNSQEIIAEIHQLKREIRDLRSNPDSRERLIREELGYARENEQIIWVTDQNQAERQHLKTEFLPSATSSKATPD